jgi:PhzF family phenazine biosynthesis protein
VFNKSRQGVFFLKVPVYQVDAFTSKACKGNPAAVCILERELSEAAMLDIAAEMNLSETAFIQALEYDDTAGLTPYSIRWFTPKTEMPLCGHATLAASKVIFDCLDYQGDRILFRSMSGVLESRRHAGRFTLDFPADKLQEPGPVSDLLEAMGIRKYTELVYGTNTNKLVVRLQSEKEVRELEPNFERMKAVKACFPIKGVGVTAEGAGEHDIISRYFNPWAGVNEDPVTGSVHTVLAPYWSAVLGKRELKALQASERCGEILIRITPGGRLEFIGDAVIVLQGEIYI